MISKRPVVYLLAAPQDRALAAAVANGLRRLGRARLSRRYITVRETGEPTTAGADRLLLLLSPAAVADSAIHVAIERWVSTRGAETIMLALAEGHLDWDRGQRRFTDTSTIPEALRAQATEPKYVALTGPHPPSPSGPRHEQFRENLVTLAATLYGYRDKEDFDSAEVRRHVQRKRRARIAAVVLALLLALAVPVTFLARNALTTADAERRNADQQTAVAEERELLAVGRQLAIRVLDDESIAPEQRLLLAAQAYRFGASTESMTALQRLLQEFASDDTPFVDFSDELFVALDTAGGALSLASQEGPPALTYRAPPEWESELIPLPPGVDGGLGLIRAVAPGGAYLLIADQQNLGASCDPSSGECGDLMLVDTTEATVHHLVPDTGTGDPFANQPDRGGRIPFVSHLFTAAGQHLVSWDHPGHLLRVTTTADPAAVVTVEIDDPMVDFGLTGDNTIFVLTRTSLRLLAFDGQERARIPLAAASVDAAAVDPATNQIVLATQGVLRRVALDSGAVTATVDTGLDHIDEVVIDPTGRSVAVSGGGDGALITLESFLVVAAGPWGVVGTSARFARENSGEGTELAFDSDGTRLTMRPRINDSGGWGTLRTWRIDPAEWYETACRLAGRPLTDIEWAELIGITHGPRACT